MCSHLVLLSAHYSFALLSLIYLYQESSASQNVEAVCTSASFFFVQVRDVPVRIIILLLNDLLIKSQKRHISIFPKQMIKPMINPGHRSQTGIN